MKYKTRERKGYKRGTAQNFLHSFPLSGTPVVHIGHGYFCQFESFFFSKKQEGEFANCADFCELSLFFFQEQLGDRERGGGVKSPKIRGGKHFEFSAASESDPFYRDSIEIIPNVGVQKVTTFGASSPPPRYMREIGTRKPSLFGVKMGHFRHFGTIKTMRGL